MKYLPYILITLAIGLAFYLVFSNEKPQQNEIIETEQTTLDIAKGNWETKTDDQPPITIRVTPVEFDKDMKTWKFQVVFDTHSGSLDDDLLTVASIVDDRGNAYQPTVWEGPGSGGHHREGALTFEAINPVPSYLELKIKDVGGIPERSFRWVFE